MVAKSSTGAEYRLETLDVMGRRYSVRDYAPFQPVPPEHLKMLAKAALLAPSASNFQPWSFVFVTDANRVLEVGSAATQKFVSRAHALVVGVVEKQVSPRWQEFDLAIAMEHIVLVATELGYGTCHIGSFNAEKVREHLQIPTDYKIVEMLTLGIPSQKENTFGRFRKPLEETVFFNRWGTELGSET